jgi:hypothetical protein
VAQPVPGMTLLHRVAWHGMAGLWSSRRRRLGMRRSSGWTLLIVRRMLRETGKRDKADQHNCPRHPLRDVFSLPHFFGARKTRVRRLVLRPTIYLRCILRSTTCAGAATDLPQRRAALPDRPASRNRSTSRGSCPEPADRSLPCPAQSFPRQRYYWAGRFRLHG